VLKRAAEGLAGFNGPKTSGPIPRRSDDTPRIGTEFRIVDAGGVPKRLANWRSAMDVPDLPRAVCASGHNKPVIGTEGREHHAARMLQSGISS
jgi:hypothetical protein